MPTVSARLVAGAVGAVLGVLALVGDSRPVVGHPHQTFTLHGEKLSHPKSKELTVKLDDTDATLILVGVGIKRRERRGFLDLSGGVVHIRFNRLHIEQPDSLFYNERHVPAPSPHVGDESGDLAVGHFPIAGVLTVIFVDHRGQFWEHQPVGDRLVARHLDKIARRQSPDLFVDYRDRQRDRQRVRLGHNRFVSVGFGSQGPNRSVSAIVASKARCRSCGNGFPFLSARFMIPSHARELK